jgi:hypothetical protein
MVGAGLVPAPRHRWVSTRGDKDKFMLTYEVYMPAPETAVAGDELWRVEFRAPMNGHNDVLIWVDNIPREAAILVQNRAEEDSEYRCSFCRRCPAGDMTSQHDYHDDLPEERGWFYKEMTSVRIMPMREAV